MVKGGLQVRGHSDGLTGRGLREDLLWLIQDVIVATGERVSYCRSTLDTAYYSRPVQKPDSMRAGEVRRKLMSIHFGAGTAVKIDDFQSNAGGLEENISQCLHSRMVDLDLVGVNVGFAVAVNRVGKHKGSIIVRTSLHPGRRECLKAQVSTGQGWKHSRAVP